MEAMTAETGRARRTVELAFNVSLVSYSSVELSTRLGRSGTRRE
jgi:hypothetical protein